MYDRVLIPVDGSSRSESVIPYAVGLGRLIDAQVCLVRIVKNRSERAQVDDELSRLADRVGTDHRVAESADVAATILREAASVPHTLVAMATHGRSDVASTALASVTRKVVHLSGESVLALRGTEKSAPEATTAVTEVLLPLDGSTLSESMRIEAISWARALGARLSVVQVLPDSLSDDAAFKSADVLESSYVAGQASRISHEFGVETNYEVLHGRPGEALVDYVSGRRDVLGVIATRGHRPIHSSLVGSVTSQMVRNAGIPLIVRAPSGMTGDTSAA